MFLVGLMIDKEKGTKPVKDQHVRVQNHDLPYPPPPHTMTSTVEA